MTIAASAPTSTCSASTRTPAAGWCSGTRRGGASGGLSRTSGATATSGPATELLFTPHIALEGLWDRSGHTDFYRESMYSPMEDEGRGYRVRPMNCPFHILIYRNRLRSHRELPMRWAELGACYRREMSGALHGLLRVRGFTQDDAHIFCTAEQLEDEILQVLDLALELLGAFGFEDFNIVLATRPDKAVGSDDIWERATRALESALRRKEVQFELDPGGGAFYGPKIDVNIRDAIGREWQCSTVQLDFNLPERFELEYVAADGLAAPAHHDSPRPAGFAGTLLRHPDRALRGQVSVLAGAGADGRAGHYRAPGGLCSAGAECLAGRGIARRCRLEKRNDRL